MPVHKYRSVAELPPPPERMPFDPSNLTLALSLSALCFGLRPWRFPAGVHKHRSFEAMCRVQEDWAARGRESTTSIGYEWPQPTAAAPHRASPWRQSP